MNNRISILAALTITLLGSLDMARADEIKPVQGGGINLGSLSGVAYYTAEPKGYRVVVTLAPRAAAPAVRFETVLATNQSVTVSTPKDIGAASEQIEIARIADTVRVSPIRNQAVTLEAAALN